MRARADVRALTCESTNRDSGTEIFVRDYDTPQIQGVGNEDANGEPLLETRPEGVPGRELVYPNEQGWRVGSDVNSLD